MVYRRGTASLEIEVSRLQSKTEDWSEVLDGENGFIRQWQDSRAERRLLMSTLKVIAWVLGPVTVYQAITAALDFVRRIHS